MDIQKIQCHPHYKQIKLTILFIIGIFTYFAWVEIAQCSYEQTFIISAYYSPIEGQTKYVTGSFEGDVRLNGEGVHSADGSQVFPGMIAAPSSYAFGTKMNIPGIGVVSVHDRGGAIVHAGQRGAAFDRLDVWMGYGDAGLSRALSWGKRTVNVTVYGIDPNIKENVYLEGFTIAEKFVRNIVMKQNIFKEDLWYGLSGDKVGTLQEYLAQLGYYKGKIDKYYGDEVYKAVIAFQIDQNIVDNEEEFGAGYMGPVSRSKIEAIFDKKKKENLPVSNLGRDDAGDEVKKLQEALKQLGYDVEINGVYDEKTIDAVFEFQKENEIVDLEEDLGAGYFGPKTFEVLAEKLSDLNEENTETIKSTNLVHIEYLAFTQDLKLGDSGDDVKRLQEELKKFNLFRTEATGFYGEVTQNAVIKFQQKKGIIEEKNSSGSGTFGPKTRDTLNGILGYRENTKALIAAKTEEYKKDEILLAQTNTTQETIDKEINSTDTVIETPIETPVETPKIKPAIFDYDLSLGSNGDEVKILQETLQKHGFYQGGLTTKYFGDVTKDAVIAFQKANGIILSDTDEGAGLVGPKTRELLNSLI